MIRFPFLKKIWVPYDKQNPCREGAKRGNKLGGLYSNLGDMAVPRYLLAAFPEPFNNQSSLA